MKERPGRHFCLSALILAASPGMAFADGTPDQAIVTLVPGESIEAFNADFGTTLLGAIPDHWTYLLQVPEGTDEEVFEESAQADPRVVDAELNDDGNGDSGGSTQSFYLNVTPSTFSAQYTWARIDLGGAHATSTGAGVTVAILDTGIDPTHPVFAGTTILPGANLVEEGSAPADVGDGADTDGDLLADELVGHGTFLAGLIATVAPDATIMPIRVLDGDGFGSTFRVAHGIYLAVDAGADVINLSLGSDVSNQMLDNALEYAAEAGVIVVAAAGNLDLHDPDVYPATMSDVIAVGATDAFDVKSDFSNYGEFIGLSAPGTAVVSILPGGGYGAADGTSASVALVAGATALLRAAVPAAEPQDIDAALQAGAFNLDPTNPGHLGQLGAGRLSAALALTALLNDAVIPGDLDQSSAVDTVDLLGLLAEWGTTDSEADLDGDQIVGIADLLILLSNWT